MNLREAILAILIAVTFVTVPLSLSSMMSVGSLENDLEDAEDDIDYWKEESIKWENLYMNYECPNISLEPIVIYEDVWHNETIYETIWNNQTILINNSICDVNRDGIVDVLDASEVLWYIKYGRTWAENIIFEKFGNPYEKLYDVNIDGNVNRADVYYIWDNSD
jgi:hypothetical protein